MADFTVTIAEAPAAFADEAQAFLGECAKLMKRIVDVVCIEVVRATPADTGLARSNWQASLSAEAVGVIPPHFPYPKFSKANGQETLEQANASVAIALAKAAVANYSPDDTAFLVNNVDYIGDLNEGVNRGGYRPTTQAPRAFVETSIMRGINEAANSFTI